MFKKTIFNEWGSGKFEKDRRWIFFLFEKIKGGFFFLFEKIKDGFFFLFEKKIILSVFLFLFLLPSDEAFSQPYAYVVVPDTFNALNSALPDAAFNYDITVIDVNTDMVIGHINIPADRCRNIVSTSASAPGLISSADNSPITRPHSNPANPPIPRRYRITSPLADAVVDSDGDKLYLICSPFVAGYGVLLEFDQRVQTGVDSITNDPIFGNRYFETLLGEREQGRVFVIDVSNIATDLAAATNNVITADIMQEIEVGDAPNDLALSPDGRYLYVANGNVPIDWSAGAGDPVVSALSGITTPSNGMPIQTTLYTDANMNPPHDFSCGADGSSCEDDDTVGFITRIDTTDYSSEPIPISDGGQLVSPTRLAFSPDGRYLFVGDNNYHPLRDPTSRYSANHANFDGTPVPGFEKGNFNSVNIGVFDLEENSFQFVTIEDRRGIYDMIVSSDGTLLFVIFDPFVLSLRDDTVGGVFDHRVVVFNACASSLTPIGFYNVGSDPRSMAFGPDGRELYISRIVEDSPDYTGVDTEVVSFLPTPPFEGSPNFQTYNIIQQSRLHTGFPFSSVQQRKLAFSPDGSKLFVTIGETNPSESFSNTDPNDPRVVIYDLEADTRLATININEWFSGFASTINIAIAGQRASVEGDCPAPRPDPPPILAVEICNDGIDNDFDGRMDCKDGDCADNLVCQPEICDDTVDNDGDGMEDCDDSECANDPICPTEPDDPCADREDGASAGEGMVCCDGEATMGTECPVTPPRRRSDSGCTLAGSATVGTATASVLLPMMVFGLAFGVRRRFFYKKR